MNRSAFMRYGLGIVFVILLFSAASAETPPAETAQPSSEGPAVFLDWPGSDLGFIRNEIPFAEFVPSLGEAQIHIVVTSTKTEDTETFTLAFKGRGEFENDDNTLSFTAASDTPPADVRTGIVRNLKIGLVRYVAKTPMSEFIKVDFKEEVKPTDVEDKWDFWVFNLSANTFFNGEQQFSHNMYFGNFSASRVTPELKIRMSAFGSLSRQKFTFGDEIIRGSSESFGFSGLFVKSLSEHWSAGVFLSGTSSSYQNLDVSVTAAPAVEYNVFPYSESTKKQLRFLYRIGYTGVKYREETIYFKTKEGLLSESLAVSLELKQPWGTIGTTVEGKHYFHDFKKYRLVLGGDINLRIWKGRSFKIDGSYSLIRDQLSISGVGLSLEDILLRQRELSTGYNYSISVGFNFTFGSTRSNVVNPRFGGGGGDLHQHVSPGLPAPRPGPTIQPPAH